MRWTYVQHARTPERMSTSGHLRRLRPDSAVEEESRPRGVCTNVIVALLARELEIPRFDVLLARGLARFDEEP